MRLQIRHLSGSRAGAEQTFNASSIRIGRDPSCDIAFDPHRDLLVSARHAELAYDGQQWTVRDIGSSNGTFVNEERITSRVLKPGDSVQFGRGGPKLEVQFERDPADVTVDHAGTSVMSVNDIVSARRTSGSSIPTPAPAGADGTVMMSASDFRASAAPPIAAAPAPATLAQPRPANNTLRIVLVAAIGFVAIAAIAVVLLRKPSAAPQQQPAATDSAAAQLQAQVASLTAQLQATEAKMKELDQQRTKTETSDLVSQDLERQYQLAQSTIEDLRHELESKNDALHDAVNRPPRKIVQYVPVPQRVIVPQTQTAPAPTPQTAAVPMQTPPPLQVASAEPPPVVQSAPPQIALATPQPAAPQTQPQQPSTQITSYLPSQPSVVAPVSNPAPARSTYEAPRTTTPVRTNAPVATVAAAPSLESTMAIPLTTTKILKRRVSVMGVPPPIALPNAPPSLSGDLARAIGAALTSSGDYALDRNATSGIRVTVENFRSQERGLDTKSGVSKLRGLASAIGAGSSIPKVPVSARSKSYDAALSAQVTVVDAQGRQIAAANPSYSVADRRSAVSIDPMRVSTGDLVATDTPIAEVMRTVVAQSVEEVMRSLAISQPQVTVRSIRNDLATLDSGRNIRITPDDVFDVYDGTQMVARLRVESVQETTASARVLAGSQNLAGRPARYAGTIAGSPSDVALPDIGRTAVMRVKAEAKDGPGTNFKTVATVAAGAKGRHLYTVAGWTKFQNGSSSMWVPTSAVTFE